MLQARQFLSRSRMAYRLLDEPAHSDLPLRAIIVPQIFSANGYTLKIMRAVACFHRFGRSIEEFGDHRIHQCNSASCHA